jgi:hypothetical protein
VYKYLYLYYFFNIKYDELISDIKNELIPSLNPTKLTLKRGDDSASEGRFSLRLTGPVDVLE